MLCQFCMNYVWIGLCIVCYYDKCTKLHVHLMRTRGNFEVLGGRVDIECVQLWCIFFLESRRISEPNYCKYIWTNDVKHCDIFNIPVSMNLRWLAGSTHDIFASILIFRPSAVIPDIYDWNWLYPSLYALPYRRGRSLSLFLSLDVVTMVSTRYGLVWNWSLAIEWWCGMDLTTVRWLRACGGGWCVNVFFWWCGQNFG